MVGVMASSWGERAAILLNSARSSTEIPSKLLQLRQLKEVLLHRDPSLLPEFVSLLADLQAERSSPARKFLVEMIGEIGLKNMELIPDMVPSLISFLNDETPAVARQAITTGTSLFRNVLEKVAVQGLYSSEIDDSLKSSWAWMLKLKNAVSSVAVQSGTDGVRLLAVRFVEAMILLYTPDPNVPLDPPHETVDGLGFNISWLKGGHPLLNVGDLAMEASQSLHLLLDQFRFPQVKSLSNSIVIVLINSVSGIAKKRPSFYGRILPVLLGLDPASSVIKGVQVAGAHHALKNAFVACLKCTHSSAAPWRVRLIEALKAMNSGELVEEAIEFNNISGIIAGSADGSLSTKEDKISLQARDEAHNVLGRKRHTVEESSALSQDDVISEKRIRLSPHMLQETTKESLQNNLPSHGSIASRNSDSGPVQQLVGMFGALVAQGDKAAESLEILISSISSDLLAEVVMANMQYLPSSCPKAEEEGESVPNISHLVPVTQSSALVSDKFSLSTAFPLIASLFNVQPSVSHDIAEVYMREEEKTVTRAETAFIPTSVNEATAAISTSISASIELNPPVAEKVASAAQPFASDVETKENTIPGLESTRSFDETQESVDASCTATSELQGTSQEQGISLGSTLQLDNSSSGYMATYVSETLSPSTTVTDASQATSVTSLVFSTQYLLPKMLVPNVILTDEEKDQLQKVAFSRIVEAHKQVAVSGGSCVHFSLLAHLGIEYPLELDSWGLLQKHVLSDYLNNQGHELTLRVLYRLYREVEQDQDFLSSRTATSVYESFLLIVAETLRDTFPASDKSLGRLLVDVPYLSEGVLKLLQCLCSPECNGKQDKDLQSGDRVTQGLSAVWSLILHRPSNRDRCLQIALQSAIHPMEEVRMKAIRLVANKLFPMPSISQKIEDFANENLHSILDGAAAMECIDDDGSTPGLRNDSDLERPSSGVQTSTNLADNELTSDSHSSRNTPSSSVLDVQRCMALYFALCTKKHSLLRQIFSIYRCIPKAAKQAVHCHVPILVRTIGSSPELLDIISDPPNGSQSLHMQVLQTLIDAAVPSQDLISSIRRLYNSRLKDVEILIPVLSLLSKDEVLPIFPQLVNLPLDKFQAALTRVLQGSPQTGPSLTPAEVLIAIHGIDPEKDGIPLKKVMDACSACFEQRQVFTQQVMAKVLNQLVEQIPLPLLFMRTVIQTIGVYPALVEFVMEILSRLINKQIWKNPKLWVGFLKCALQTRPQSFNVLLQLPAAQLENALNKNPVLKQPLVDHASQPNIRATLPRSTLVVLGLANEQQTSGQAQPSQTQQADTVSSAVDVATEVTQESSALS